MSYTRCISSVGCPDFSLDRFLDLARRHDVPEVELRALDGATELASRLRAEFGKPERLAEHLRGSSVRIVAFNTSFHLVGTTESERDQLLALVPWAEALEVGWLRVFDGGNIAAPSELAEAAETIGWWRGVRREHGWRAEIMVETHDSLLSVETIRRFQAAVPGAAILWDAHHTWRKGGEDPVMTWRAICDHVVHVHVKDSIAVPSARHPFTYVLPGDGDFPMASLLAALRVDGFRGRVALEWERMWHPYLPTLDEALDVAAQRRWW
jgi:sugar phosphate isomerase/epimerase